MRIINAIVDALRRLLGTDSVPEIDAVEIWETPDGWTFRAGNVTWGDFPTYADAIRVAKKYNFLEVID